MINISDFLFYIYFTFFGFQILHYPYMIILVKKIIHNSEAKRRLET